MANLDYNHQLFISQFIDRLREEGFYLNKAFDETKGGRFFKEGYKDKKKAFGKYRFCDASSTSSGNPLIIYTYFGLYDKSGNEISKPIYIKKVKELKVVGAKEKSCCNKQERISDYLNTHL